MSRSTGRLLGGTVLLVLAILASAVLGTLGWFAVGFGVLTDCTNEYSCTDTGCAPCDTASRWITTGGLTQLALVVVGVLVLVRGRRAARPGTLVLGGVVLIAASLATLAGTTSAARDSYCRVGSPGYDASYCSTDD